LQSTAKLLVTCNLPASLGENRYFRDFISDMTSNRVSDKDSEAALCRKRVTQAMDQFAEARSSESKSHWSSQAATFGGSLLVDGWTAARVIGTIGVSDRSIK